jgi:hypothetical protein
VRFRVRLERPNPNYGDRAQVRTLIEGANARMAEVAWRADPSDLQGLDIDEPFIREAIEHTRKHGRFHAVGDRHGVPSTWDSRLEGAAETHVVPADPQTREVTPTVLRTELGEEGPSPGAGSRP